MKTKWNLLFEEFSTIKRSMQNAEQAKVQEEQNLLSHQKSLSEIEIRLQKVKDEHKKMLQNIEISKQKIEKINVKAGVWKQIQPEFSTLIKTLPVICKAERKLCKNLSEDIQTSPFELAALSDKNSPQSKLSLVFNLCGMSHDAILQCQEVCGSEFCVGRTSELFELYEVNLDFGGKIDLQYCQMMIKEKCDPFNEEHKKNCPVCFHDTPELLIELLEEHKISLMSAEKLRQFEITGSRALVISEFRNEMGLSVAEMKVAIRAVSYLRGIHFDFINRGAG